MPRKNELDPATIAALVSLSGEDPEIREAVREFLRDYLEEYKRRKQERQQFIQNRLDIIKQEEANRNRLQERCTHRKEDGTSRLAGQRLSGTGQICLVCMGCAKTFYMPAQEGQEPVPPDLIPHGDAIGG